MPDEHNNSQIILYVIRGLAEQKACIADTLINELMTTINFWREHCKYTINEIKYEHLDKIWPEIRKKYSAEIIYIAGNVIWNRLMNHSGKTTSL